MKHTITMIAGLTAATLAVIPGVAGAAAAGDLDPSFDGDGRVIRPIAATPADVLIQPDGKIVVTGTTGDEDFGVWRLNGDGSPDRGFDGDGAAVADLGGSDYVSSAALQPDGKIVVVGHADGYMAIARFNGGGSLDTTFAPGEADGDGKKVIAVPGFTADGVVVQRDGKLALVGTRLNSSGLGDFTITRLLSTGAPDAAKAPEDADFGGDDTVVTAAPAPDGKIVVVGVSKPAASEPVIAVARYNHDGSLDKTFKQTGKTTVGPGVPTAVLAQADGKVLVVSRTDKGDPRVTRLTDLGEVDPEFGDGGTAAGGFDGEKLAPSIVAAVRPDGRIFVAGTPTAISGWAIGRLDSGGALDPAFGSGGTAVVPFTSLLSVVTAAAVQPDGNLVVAGATLQGTSPALTVARVLGATPPPPSGGPGPVTPTSMPRCDGRRATIVGTAGRDTLRGTRRADVIVARGGNDRVLARGGNDVVCGGAGSDRLSGGPGRDRLVGGAGHDRCIGAAGRDRSSGCERRRSQ